MATIVLTSYMVRHPVGGVLSSNLQLILGFTRLGHDVYVFETAGYPKSCFDPVRNESGDDCSRGIARVEQTLRDAGLERRLCFVSADGTYHGMTEHEVRQVFSRCDLYVDRGDHRVWIEESSEVPVRILIDPDPGYRQIKLARSAARGEPPPVYDAYYTYGHNVASGSSTAPTAGISWRHMFHPVDCDWVEYHPHPREGPFSTVMNWASHKAVEYEGNTLGMKDIDFYRFLDLPRRTSARLEVAIAGRDAPVARIRSNGWIVRSALEVTDSLDSYLQYIRRSFGEFSVVKEIYRALAVGWFSDRSAMYLAMGRPVIIEDNGLSGVLPLGEGLFSVETLDEAAEAIDAVRSAPERHSKAAREIAWEYLDSKKVLGRLLAQLGLPVNG